MQSSFLRVQSLVPLLLGALLAACGGGGGDPCPDDEGLSIATFEASPATFFPGAQVSLTACFSGGTARLEPDGLPVTSGVPISVGPSPTGMTFTLVVSDGVREVRRELGVPLRYRHRLTLLTARPAARADHAAVALSNGRVLVVGGRSVGNAAHVDAEVFDPVAGTFTPAGELASPRWGMTGVLLPGDRVAIAGGLSTSSDPDAARRVEVWDPATHAWSELGVLASRHIEGTVHPLPLRPWLVAGGVGAQPAVELFEPLQGSTRVPEAAMAVNRSHHSATYTAEARLLLVGGLDRSGQALASAERWDPGTERFEPTAGAPLGARASHAAVYLAPDAQVLLAGGGDGTGRTLASAELYDVESGTFLPTGPLQVAREEARALLLASGEVLVVGGLLQGEGAPQRATDTLETYDPGSGTFTLREARLPGARIGHTLTLLPDGRVLILGGADEAGFPVAEALLYD